MFRLLKNYLEFKFLRSRLPKNITNMKTTNTFIDLGSIYINLKFFFEFGGKV